MRVCVCICMSMGEGAHVCVSVCLEARGQSQESSSGLLSLRSLSHWPRSPQFGQTASHPWDYKNAPPHWLFTWDLGLKLQSSWLCARHFTHGALSSTLASLLISELSGALFHFPRWTNETGRRFFLQKYKALEKAKTVECRLVVSQLLSFKTSRRENYREVTGWLLSGILS